MVYTNDEADRQTRQRDYYLKVYALPIALIVIVCGLLYWACLNNYLTKSDTIYGYMMSFTPGLLLYAFNKQSWLKMPDGTFHYIKGIPSTLKININEPSTYEATYYYAKKEKISTALTGLGLFALSIWLVLKGLKYVIVPLVTNIGALFLLYYGIKGLLDKSEKLKIAKNGLWTSKLGFVSWDDVNYADVIEEKNGESPQVYLQVRLKGTKFEEADQADERLLLSDLKGYEMVEFTINTCITNYNALKK